MPNPFQTIEHVSEVILHDVELPLTFLIKAERVVASAIKDQPQLKDTVLSLIHQAEVVIGDVASAGASKGLNLATDAKALADAEAFFEYFKSTFMPLVDAVYHEVLNDIQ